MLQGQNIGLRALEAPDLPQLQIWRNNAGIRRYYREYRELTMYDQENWFKSVCCGNRNFCMFGVVARRPLSLGTEEVSPGALIGVCGLTNIQWIIRSAELSFYIGAGDIYVDSVCAPEAVHLLCQYAFDTLNMHKVWAEIYNFDIHKTALFEQIKMHKDGILRDNAYDGGTYHDSYIYSLLQFEYLKSLTRRSKK